ncbi:MAG: hypothetical protein WD044_08720 [Dongiaceae bacterium]
MRDNEIRGMVLKTLYDLRHTSDLINVDQSFNMPEANENVLHNIFEQLNESRLVMWRPVVGGLGVARITSFGVDVVEGEAKPPISVVIDHSINVHSSSNVQIGKGNVQNIDDMEKLNIAIDQSTANHAEKAEARSLLASLS